MTPRISTVLADWGATPPVWVAPAMLERIETICRAVATAAQINPAALFITHRGPKRVANARQLAMAIVRVACRMSLQDAGRVFAGRDPGTVLHACKIVHRECKANPRVADLYQTLTSK